MKATSPRVFQFAGLWVLFFIMFGPASTLSQVSDETLPQPTSTYTILTDGPISFPFEIFDGDIRFKCQLNGNNVFMLLDDGFMWDELLLWGAEARQWDLNYTGELDLVGSNDETSSAPNSLIAEGLTLRLPGIEFTSETAVVSPVGNWYERVFDGSIGQISGTFLKNFAVDINFDKMMITLIEFKKFEYSGSGMAVDWKPLGFGPWGIPVTFGLPDGREIEMPVLMDLGYNNQVQIVTGGDHGFTMPEKTLVLNMDRGTGIIETFHLGRLPSVVIGNYELKDVLVSLLPENHNTMVFTDVMAGLNLLTRFNVVYDFHHQRLFLEPNQMFVVPFEHTMSGFKSRYDENGSMIVIQVDADSPACDVGLVKGDLIAQINGQTPQSFDYAELQDLMKREGTTITLQVIQDNKTKEIALLLRRII